MDVINISAGGLRRNDTVTRYFLFANNAEVYSAGFKYLYNPFRNREQRGNCAQQI